MSFKMKEHFVVYIFLVILFSNDCDACFKENTVSYNSITTFSGFYENCCCTEEGFTIDDLKWMDPQNETIGLAGTASKVYIERKGEEEEKLKTCLTLLIPSASKTASGTYRCTTTYKGLPHFQTHHIDIYDPLYFVDKKPSQYLVNSADSKIYCKARGLTEPYYRWYRGNDGQGEIYPDSVKYQFVSDGVIVRNVTDDDAGIYKCTASVPSTGEEDELDINVQVMTIPVIENIVADPEDTVTEGQSLILDCVADAFPIPEFSWRKISDTVGLTNIRQKVSNENKNETWKQENNTIRFKSIKVDDAGIYECYVKNFAGNASSSIEIKVLQPPNITLFPNKEVVEDTSISLHCAATGNPPPNITITYEGKSLEEEENDETYDIIDNFALFKVNRSNEGYYICNASNEVDFMTQEMYLTVLHKPYFEVDEEYVWGWPGEIVELNCAHEANPPANTSCKYEKSADAIANETEVNAELNSVDINSSLTYTFNITEDFAPYGDYECVSRNYLGQDSKLIVFQKGFVPSVIRFNSVANVTATSVTFTIETPFLYKGPDVLGIKAEYDTAENYRITHIHRNRTWAIGRLFKLEKLKPNSTYYIRFAAINRVGSGPWGPNLSFDTLDKSAPEPPIWLLDSPQLPPSNVLKWKAPEDNGEPIDYYALRYCPELDEYDESPCKEQRIVGETELKLSDLQYNNTYNFELIAHNAQGNSTASNITLSISAPDMPSSKALLSEGAVIGISIVLVILCLILLDLLLLFWRQQGIIASCCYKKSKKKPNPLHTRDKKGLLKDNGESTDDTLKRPNNGHREYEYNKTTGIITGKHSSV